ncbi:PcfJ domain-containing protein [Halomonas cupida]|uniref:PcfJ domain-containing protein n=1 Tax=Halomonas cupida TaxID=44933 RepID=UPI003A93FA6F
MDPVLLTPDSLSESIDHCIRHRKDGEDALEEACDLIWPSLESQSLMVEWLSETDVTRLFRSEGSRDGTVTFTMMGLWRIVRSQGCTRTYRRDLKRRQWKADKTLDRWPILKLLPCGTVTQLPYVWESLLEHAFNEVFRQAIAALTLPQPWRRHLQRELQLRWQRQNSVQVLLGLDRDVEHMVRHDRLRYPMEADNCDSCIEAWEKTHRITGYGEYSGPDRGPEECSECADNQRVLDEYEQKVQDQLASYVRYLSHIRSLDLGRGRPFFQQRYIATRNMKALKSALWRDVIDRESLSLTSRIVGPRSRIHLRDVLRVQTQREAIERIASERPQLLPMLSVIHSRHWHRDDLFSRRLWVHQEEERTIVDRKTFCLSRRIGSLNEKRSFRFLSRSPASVVAMLLNVWQDSVFGWKRSEADAVLQFIQSVTPTQDHRPYAKVLGATAGLKVVKVIKGNRFDNGLDQPAMLTMPVFGHLARAWVANRLETWRTHGYRELMRTRPHADQALRNALDWSASTEYHLPDNNMDWTAIQRHSDAWHEAQQQQYQDRTQYRNKDLSWTSPLQEIRSDAYVAAALTDSQSLQQEGHEMGHCVGSYDVECYEGGYLVFSIKPLGPDADKSDRATLGVFYSRVGARFDQLEGPCYQSTPKPIQDFAHHIIQSLNDAILENAA